MELTFLESTLNFLKRGQESYLHGGFSCKIEKPCEAGYSEIDKRLLPLKNSKGTGYLPPNYGLNFLFYITQFLYRSP